MVKRLNLFSVHPWIYQLIMIENICFFFILNSSKSAAEGGPFVCFFFKGLDVLLSKVMKKSFLFVENYDSFIIHLLKNT